MNVIFVKWCFGSAVAILITLYIIYIVLFHRVVGDNAWHVIGVSIFWRN
jgi:hypothetical protein